MIPQRIYLKGFMSYRDEQSLLFDKAPLWVLTGENGSGKSSVFDAITFALYGWHRGGGKDANQLINHDSDGLIIEFDFILEQTIYRIRRTLSKKNNKATREASTITIDGNGKEKVKPIEGTTSDKGFNEWIKDNICLDYTTFTSSVLLLQGQSEKLLTALPKERYEILTEIIDLSLYDKLASKADTKRKEWDKTVSVLEKQIGSMPEIDEEKSKSLDKQVKDIEKQYNETNELVEQWTNLINQAGLWENLQKKIQEAKENLETAKKTLENAEEIKSKYKLYKDLEQTIPNLEELKKNQLRIIDQETKINQLALLIQEERSKLAKIEEEKRSTQEQYESSQKLLIQLEKNENDLFRQIDKANGLIDKLKDIEKLNQQLQEISLKIEKIPKDLTELIVVVESNLEKINENERALPWLKQISSTYKALKEFPAQEKTISDNLAKTELELSTYEQNSQSLKNQIDALAQTENQITHNITSQNTLYQQLQTRMEEFTKLAGNATCDLCGQLITEEHKYNEEVRLRNEIQTLASKLSLLETQHQDIKEQKNNLLQQENIINTSYNQLLQIKQKYERELEDLKKEHRNKVELLRNDLSNLPKSFYLQLVGSANVKEINVDMVDLPSSEILAAMQSSINLRKDYEEELKDLRAERETGLQDVAKKEQIENLLREQQSNLNIAELQKTRDEFPNLLTAQKDLEVALKDHKQLCENIQEKLNMSVNELQTLSSSLQNNQHQFATENRVKEEIENNFQSSVERLSEQWKSQVNRLTQDFIDDLKKEQINLTTYVNEYTELQKIETIVPTLEQQIKDLETDTQRIPLQAQKDVSSLEEELSEYKNNRKHIEEQLTQARVEMHKDKQNLKQWRELRSQKRVADDNLLIYKMLTDLLGRNGLQMYLLREAEKAIVDYANEVLDNLSRGKLRLQLQGTDGASQSESGKALDLVFYNYHIGNQPMSVAFASGSQRFRIAVSLALAIGRYVGQNAGRIKSVIIDEGFGSLDKNGREDMIQELTVLQQQLAKIILVSHQEDFTKSFTNGYTIKIKEGTSQVHLFENN